MSLDIVDLPAEAIDARRVLAPFLLAGADGKALTAALRPRPEDYALVFNRGLCAGLQAAYDATWATDPVITRKSHQNVLLASACLAEGFFPGSPMMEAFPGGYAGLAEHLVPGRTWVCWKFVAPGERLGMAWDGLVHVEERWVWFPRAWAFVKRLAAAPGSGPSE